MTTARVLEPGEGAAVGVFHAVLVMLLRPRPRPRRRVPRALSYRALMTPRRN